MGGSGSTRWGRHSKKQTVENSLKLTVSDLLKYSMALKTPGKPRGIISWKRREQSDVSILFALDLRAAEPVFVLDYSANGHPVNQVIYLTATACRYGGVRYWFSCPRCKRRCACLYLPLTQLNAIRFYCRTCHDLAYTSSQEAHFFDRRWWYSAALNQSYKLDAITDKWIRGERLTRGEKRKLKAALAEEV